MKNLVKAIGMSFMAYKNNAILEFFRILVMLMPFMLPPINTDIIYQ